MVDDEAFVGVHCRALPQHAFKKLEHNGLVDRPLILEPPQQPFAFREKGNAAAQITGQSHLLAFAFQAATAARQGDMPRIGIGSMSLRLLSPNTMTLGTRSVHVLFHELQDLAVKGGVERMVAVVKQSFWSVWLDLELEVNRSQSVEAETHLPLGGLLWQAALLYTCRCHNLWHTGLNDVTTPIDRVHEQIVQRTRTLGFGSVVFASDGRETTKARGGWAGSGAGKAPPWAPRLRP